MLFIQNISYIHSNKDVLFQNVRLSVDPSEKVGLVGPNGSGKSTLLRLAAKELPAADGQISSLAVPCYIPQILGQFNDWTVAKALRIDVQMDALRQIIAGSSETRHFDALNDDWTLEERAITALRQWHLEHVTLDTPLQNLSGGEKTRVFLAGLSVHHPELILLDEPSNHLDLKARETLYELIETSRSAMLIVSHDRELLARVNRIAEMTPDGLAVYGGNFDFYQAQKQLRTQAVQEDIHEKEKALRKARDKQKETLERQQKLDARGHKKQEKAGLPTIMMNTLRNQAEQSTASIKAVHQNKIGEINRQLHDLRNEVTAIDEMKFGFNYSGLHRGKVLFEADNLDYRFNEDILWKSPLNFQFRSGDRIALRGANGSGKSTLLRLLTGELTAIGGSLYRSASKLIYVDQEYSLLDLSSTVYGQAQQFNVTPLPEHEVKIRLNRFLFPKSSWDKGTELLSGGEKMRLILCCLTIGNQTPDLIILDEPTNNLDLLNLNILTQAIRDYPGTLVVVSHDSRFLKEIGIEQYIDL